MIVCGSSSSADEPDERGLGSGEPPVAGAADEAKREVDEEPEHGQVEDLLREAATESVKISHGVGKE
jgi:hypothetical protein